MQVYRGIDIGTAKPTRGRAGRRCRTTSSTSPTPATTGRWRARRRAPAPRSRHRGPGQAGAARRRDRPLRAARSSTTSQIPAEDLVRASRAGSRDRARRRPGRRVRASSPTLDPAAAARIEPRQPSAHRARARGDRAHRPAVLVVRPGSRPLRRRRSSRSRMVGVWLPRGCPRRRIAARVRRRCATPAWSTRSRGLAARPAALAHRRPRRSGTARCSTTSTARSRRSTPRLDADRAAHPRVRPPPAHVVPARPARSRWLGTTGDDRRCSDRRPRSGAATRRSSPHDATVAPRPSCTPPATTSSCTSRSTPTPLDSAASRPRSATATAGSAPTGCISLRPAATAPTAR